ncbi:MAG: phosphatidylserine decarboxylase [Thomasclavelia sp.]|nr:phosphatidylserine decarboxylase [Thomasclavelia sp.]
MILDRKGNKVSGNETQNNLLDTLYSTSLGRCALKILTCKFVSVIGGLYMSSPLSTAHINSFIKNNDIDMTQYEEKRYHSYNDFFTRKIKTGKRYIDQDYSVLISPADSKLTYYPIEEDCKFTVKNTVYNVSDFLEDEQLAKEYNGGSLLIFRLTVDDYHRYCFIDDGSIILNKYIPGVFHTVNPIANDYYPIYKTNSREVSIINTENFGEIAYVEVGAMMVGRIENHKIEYGKKGMEKGFFKFGGSTIVLLLKKDQIRLDSDIISNSKNNIETRVLYGERIGVKEGKNG